MEVGLLGGSFDPVHHGHLLAARALRETLQLDEVRLVPAGEQPFKGRHRASAAERLRMVTLAVEDEAGLGVEAVEAGRPGPSWTIDTLEQLRNREPGSRFVLLIGSDAAAEFAAWRDAARIPDLAEVVVYQRPGAPVPAGFRSVAVPGCDISATAIRARVREGRSIRYLVPDRVAEYIAARRLYRGE